MAQALVSSSSVHASGPSSSVRASGPSSSVRASGPSSSARASGPSSSVRASEPSSSVRALEPSSSAQAYGTFFSPSSCATFARALRHCSRHHKPRGQFSAPDGASKKAVVVASLGHLRERHCQQRDHCCCCPGVDLPFQRQTPHCPQGPFPPSHGETVPAHNSLPPRRRKGQRTPLKTF